MSSVLAGTEAGNGNPTTWHRWCRLCAKDHPMNRSVFSREDRQNSWTSMLAMTIGKYFWVDIKREDEHSNYLCDECFTLMDCLIEFSERVRKVQTLFNRLQTLKPDIMVDFEKIRADCGLVTDEWKHMMSRAVELPPLPKQEEFVDVDQEIAGEPNDEILLRPSLEVEQHFDQKQELGDEEVQIAGQELQITEIEEGIMEDGENLAEEEVETVEEEVEPHETSDCLVEEELIPDEDYIEESEIIEESQVEDFHIETYEVISHKPQAEPTKNIEESMESEDDPQVSHIIEETQVQDFHIETYEVISQKSQAEPAKTEDIDGSMESDEDRSPEHLIEDEVEIPEEPAIYKCSICNKPYKKPKAYKRHMEEVHNTVPKDLPQLECNQCGLSFSSVSQLHAHYRSHLPAKVKPDNSCPHCEKVFTTPGTLKRHIDGVHKQIKPYVCDLCGKSFNYITGLKDHKLVHTEECPFECPVCKRRFKNKARLKIHSDTHSEQNYECTICGVKLKTRRTFNKHKLVHSDERLYKCDVCGSAFKRSKTLKAHLILHTGIRPYKCNFCGRDFTNGSNCRSHKRQSHPKELAEEESRGVSRSTLLPMLEELTKASKLIKTPAKPSKTKGSRPKVSPKKPECTPETTTKDTDGAILYELVEELDYS
ncbi:zinc finger protein weckle [Drosophila rhopaloa]|uniref:Zinc finger protein weckle n=1 Tax=Drosophila rhopaloa TaxID=1041015 RepID=A0A6P4EH97_DRORH|nr:zinc finger protein weckle [Drosophila rhopaloa]